jgi:hypothetical protein
MYQVSHLVGQNQLHSLEIVFHIGDAGTGVPLLDNRSSTTWKEFQIPNPECAPVCSRLQFDEETVRNKHSVWTIQEAGESVDDSVTDQKYYVLEIVADEN